MARAGRGLAVVVVLLAAYMLSYFHRTMTGVMKPEVEVYAGYYRVEPGVLLAVMASAYFYSYAASQLFTGVLLDYYGVKRVGSLMLAVLGLATLLMLFPSPYTLVLGRGLVGFSAAVAFLSYMRTTSLGFGVGVQARLTALLLFAGSLTSILATYPLRLLLDSMGLQYTLIALALAAFTLALLVYGFSSDTGGGRGGSYNPFKTLRIAAGSAHVWATGFAAVATYGLGLAYQSAWGQLHLEKVFAMDKHSVSLYLMIVALVFTATVVPVGVASDRIGRRKPILVASTLLSTLSWLLLYTASLNHSTTLLQASLALLGLALGLHSVAPTMAKEPYDPKVSGTVASVFNVTLFTGIALLQSILTLLDPLTSLKISIAVALAGVFVATVFTRETYGKGRG